MWRRGWGESTWGTRLGISKSVGGSYSSCLFLCALGTSLEAASRNVSENKALEIISSASKDMVKLVYKQWETVNSSVGRTRLYYHNSTNHLSCHWTLLVIPHNLADDTSKASPINTHEAKGRR